MKLDMISTYQNPVSFDQANSYFGQTNNQYSFPFAQHQETTLTNLTTSNSTTSVNTFNNLDMFQYTNGIKNLNDHRFSNSNASGVGNFYSSSVLKRSKLNTQAEPSDPLVKNSSTSINNDTNGSVNNSTLLNQDEVILYFSNIFMMNEYLLKK